MFESRISLTGTGFESGPGYHFFLVLFGGFVCGFCIVEAVYRSKKMFLPVAARGMAIMIVQLGMSFRR